MNRLLLIFLCVVPTTAFAANGLSLSHTIALPGQFSSGRERANQGSDAEAYVSGYETGWWRCVELYAGDIDHKITEKDRECWGSAALCSGTLAGFDAAAKRINELVRKYGAQRVKSFLADFSDPPKP